MKFSKLHAAFVLATVLAAGQAYAEPRNESRSDLGQQLQLALQDANNIYTRPDAPPPPPPPPPPRPIRVQATQAGDAPALTTTQGGSISDARQVRPNR